MSKQIQSSRRVAGQLQAFYDVLFEAFGPQHWWPARTKTEMIVGSILTQNTSWTSVETAIANLRAAGCLNWKRLREIPTAKLAELIRAAGPHNVKAARLKSFVAFLDDNYGGSLRRMFAQSLGELRSRLLSVNGVGPETADAILLYAGGYPTFVIDAYTRRVMRRHRLADDRSKYDDLKSLFESNLPSDADLFNEYHALLVELAKRYCRSKPACSGCPLERFPHDVPAAGLFS